MLNRAVLASLLVVSGGCAEVVVVPLPEELARDPVPAGGTLCMVMEHECSEWRAYGTRHNDGESTSWTFPYRPPASNPRYLLQADCGSPTSTTSWTESGSLGMECKSNPAAHLSDFWSADRAWQYDPGSGWNLRKETKKLTWEHKVAPPPPVLWQNRYVLVAAPSGVSEVWMAPGSSPLDLDTLNDALGDVLALAVDQATGTLYVLDGTGELATVEMMTDTPVVTRRVRLVGEGGDEDYDAAALDVRNGELAAILRRFDMVGYGHDRFFANAGTIVPASTSSSATNRPYVVLRDDRAFYLAASIPVRCSDIECTPFPLAASAVQVMGGTESGVWLSGYDGSLGGLWELSDEGPTLEIPRLEYEDLIEEGLLGWDQDGGSTAVMTVKQVFFSDSSPKPSVGPFPLGSEYDPSVIGIDTVGYVLHTDWSSGGAAILMDWRRLGESWQGRSRWFRYRDPGAPD
ncbi:MAG: hypothetical protein H6716_29300 [Polyangiaceae bacterium]|nr:hypothetical protein [Polyangiaceae bacterium]